MRLLLIEADASSGARLAEGLTRAGFVVQRCESAQEALSEGYVQITAAILLDVGLNAAQPGKTILPLRAAGLKYPLIVLSAQGDWHERVECLDAGADDYVLKPVRTEEIAARLRAIIRRNAGNADGRITLGGVLLDMKAKCAWLEGKCLDLTRSEYRLLRLFLLSPDHILTHTQIWHELHPGKSDFSANSVEVQIARLRGKIGKDMIRTVRGLGYRIIDIGDEASAALEGEPCRKSCKVHGPDQDQIGLNPTMHPRVRTH